MSKQLRFSTKSRFKLVLECPKKLYYTKKNEYANQKQADEFQIEELARLEYPDG